ncbi:MAG TPA: metalloregulator ArsR/SmtB family transcription factor [Devosiaceae bacterium]
MTSPAVQPAIPERTAARLLHVLKARGPQTAAALAEQLAVTAVAVRQTLERLEIEKLVSFEDHRLSVGRPKRHWQLTSAGHARFPDSHATLTLDLLNATRAVFGEAGLAQLVAHREASTLNNYRQQLAPLPGLSAKLQRLAEMRSAEGYMAEARDGGDGLLFIENHCPICAAATRCQALCRSELDVFTALLGPDVEVVRLDHIVAGARRCAYRITARAA